MSHPPRHHLSLVTDHKGKDESVKVAPHLTKIQQAKVS